MTTPAQPPARGRKRVTPATIIIVLGVALAGGAYFLYRQRKASAASQADTASTPTGSIEDFAGQLGTVQSEIGDLQSSFAQDQAAETGTGTGTGGGSSAPPPAKPPAKAPAMPATVHGQASGKNAIRLTWTAVPGATSYKAHTTYQGKAGPAVTVKGTSATIGGLTSNHTYTAHVSACNAAGCSAATNGPVAKTAR